MKPSFRYASVSFVGRHLNRLKRNPIGAALVLSTAGRAPMLTATIVATLPQGHERVLGG
jgi:hypothetical protein